MVKFEGGGEKIYGKLSILCEKNSLFMKNWAKVGKFFGCKFMATSFGIFHTLTRTVLAKIGKFGENVSKLFLQKKLKYSKRFLECQIKLISIIFGKFKNINGQANVSRHIRLGGKALPRANTLAYYEQQLVPTLQRIYYKIYL